MVVAPEQGKYVLVGLRDGTVLLVATAQAALGRTTLRARLNTFRMLFARGTADTPEARRAALVLSATGPTTGTIHTQQQQQQEQQEQSRQ